MGVYFPYSQDRRFTNFSIVVSEQSDPSRCFDFLVSIALRFEALRLQVQRLRDRVLLEVFHNSHKFFVS